MALGSGGPNLLNEVLARLGITSEGKDSMKGQFWRILQFSSNPMITLRDTLKPLMIQTIQTGSGGLDEPFSRS